MINNPPPQKIITEIIEILNNYYSCLEVWLNKAEAEDLSPKAVNEVKAQLEEIINRFWNLSDFNSTKDREKYFDEVQTFLKSVGHYLDLTPQYGIQSGVLEFETIDNMSLRPLLKEEKIKTAIGNQEIEYKEVILGRNLISLPHCIYEIVESASPAEIALFPEDLAESLENDYILYEEFKEEASKRFRLGAINTDNLFCVQLKLYEREWGKEYPNKEAQERLTNHFRLHGQQHVADFNLINSNQLTFDVQDINGSKALVKDAILEARVMVRQLLEKSLPYYVLAQILVFQKEWMDGRRSEYALAGNLLFTKLFKSESQWVRKVEELSQDELCQSALLFAYSEKNFKDMLTEEQLFQAQN
ncbi:MAG TPA: hypothetical protein PLT76_10450 [Candidatus Omnitrophota bacterium]|nr:hypothetical protein [Candidatus Omnitrophota bacterium]HQO59119.1 hypothetical protein [Candidatus Omnitrophota bacterium]